MQSAADRTVECEVDGGEEAPELAVQCWVCLQLTVQLARQCLACLPSACMTSSASPHRWWEDPRAAVLLCAV